MTISLNDPDLSAALLRMAVGATGPVIPDSETWPRWLWVAQMQRVAPLLYELVDTVPTDLTDEQRQDVRELHGSVLLRCVQLEHHMIVVSRLLAQDGIRSAVLKGGATAHLDYPDPSWREVSDIDLLIDPTDLDQAVELLGREGWVQGYALPVGHDRYTHAVTFVQDRMELDLHQRIARRSLGLRVPTSELLERSVSFELAGAELRALDGIDRVIHSALHMVVAHWRDLHLSTVADVLRAAHVRPHEAVDVLERAESFRVRPIVERGVRDAYAAAGLPVHPEWAEAMRRPIRRRDRLVERAYLGTYRRPALVELAYLRLLKGWRNRWDYVRGYFKTEPDYTEQHGRSGMRAQARYVMSKLRPK